MGEALPVLPVRQLMHLGQPNVTHDPILRLNNAVEAYDRAVNPEYMAEDPTAAGEAAALAGLAVSQFKDIFVRPTIEWFDKSLLALVGEDSGQPRKRFLTYLLMGQAFTLLALKSNSPADRKSNEATASMAFDLCKQKPVDGRDPYLTMFSLNYAAFESVREGGDTNLAAFTALQGIGQAITSKPETANSPNLSKLVKHAEHVAFIGKQVVMNASVLPLAQSKFLSRIPAVAKFREKYARKLLS
jgi:hypothetical protein